MAKNKNKRIWILQSSCGRTIDMTEDILDRNKLKIPKFSAWKKAVVEIIDQDVRWIRIEE